MKRALSKLKLATDSMPKYYAVAKGREGPKVYRNWDECSKSVSRYPGAIHKSFASLEQAETWLASSISLHAAPPSRPVDSFSDSQKPYGRTGKLKGPILALEVVKPHRLNAEASTSKIILSDEQQAVLQRIKRGESIFFSGSAGTGKSVLLREIINELKDRDPRSSTLGITASTGIAAINIGGCTLHSWAGIGIGNESAKKMAGKFIGQAKHGPSIFLDRWKKVKTLIIDEISMVDGQLFDKLEEMARLLRGNDAPFGGIQLVLSGDFFQLPPVPNRNGDEIITPVFAFDAKTWETCVGRPVTLTRVFRQKDQAFVKLLNAMRFGKIENVEAFTALAREVTYTDGLQPTELLSRRDEVERVNSRRLDQLPGNCETYEAMDARGTNSKGQRVSQEQMEKLLDRLVAPKSVGLKVGAQVMLIKNLAQGRLVNGSLGQVIGFSTARDAIERHVPIAGRENNPRPDEPATGAQLWPFVRYTNGEELLMIPEDFTINNADGGMEACRTQVPLILAWALSVHKSQGQTLERVKIDLRQTFEKGQAYVAVSRATTMEHLQILNFHPSKVVAHPRVQQWYAEIDRYRRVEEEMDLDEAMEAYYT